MLLTVAFVDAEMHFTFPFVITHVSFQPTAILLIFVNEVDNDKTGEAVNTLAAIPNCADSFAPQQYNAPALNAQVWLCLLAIIVTESSG
jgi:hypothetical protein